MSAHITASHQLYNGRRLNRYLPVELHRIVVRMMAMVFDVTNRLEHSTRAEGKLKILASKNAKEYFRVRELVKQLIAGNNLPISDEDVVFPEYNIMLALLISQRDRIATVERESSDWVIRMQAAQSKANKFEDQIKQMQQSHDTQISEGRHRAKILIRSANYRTVWIAGIAAIIGAAAMHFFG